jgi:hypothetical protein
LGQWHLMGEVSFLDILGQMDIPISFLLTRHFRLRYYRPSLVEP